MSDTQSIAPRSPATFTGIMCCEFTNLHFRTTKTSTSPKIQPISDPNPIILPTRHRMYSPRDGQWHEVIGDEEAIGILGQDVFLYGPKIMRIDRRLADSTVSASPTQERSSNARIIEREREGDAQKDWEIVQGHQSTDDAIIKHGKLQDGMDDVTESVRTLHLAL